MPTDATIQKAAFDKQNCRRFALKLSTKYDAEIIEHIQKQPSMQGYIRALIRADIAAQQQKGESP